MIKINISYRCQAWGQCVFDAPEIFDLVDGDRKTWQYEADNTLLNKVKKAEAHCPNRAISFEVIDEKNNMSAN
jgi:ferredoxin